jgi:hypothetical protein
MSNPANPLDIFETYSIKHLLVAFKFTESACKTVVPSIVKKLPGQQLEKSYCGPAYVVVNEFEDKKFFIKSMKNTFSYYSPINVSTTSMFGTLDIASQYNYEFPELLKQLTEKLDMSISHMTFWLRTAFVATNPNGEYDIIFIKPLIFHTMNNSYFESKIGGHAFSLNFMATYNTFGQLSNFSGIHQMTITHKDGALHKEIPKPEKPNCEILTRKAEDAMKAEARNKRLEKSKPMKTVYDVLKAFELELKEQRFAHKRQLQEWLSQVRNDYVKKIEEPKPKKGDELPLDYILEPGDAVISEIDNRNMPWEQPEQSQDKPGIRSITIPPGMNIVSAIDYLLKYSKERGIQSANLSTWKTNLCIVRRCGGKYDVFINVNGAEIPRNMSSGMDTGPGKGVVNKPLELKLDYPGTKEYDIDITHLFINSDSQIDYGVMEDLVKEDEAEVVYGNREQITLERIPSLPYFKSMFSGVRGMASPKNYGLEHGDAATQLDYSLLFPFRYQTSSNIIKIRGNPELYSDLCRNPWKVKNNDPHNPNLYKFPERYPIYMIIKTDSEKEGRQLGKDEDQSLLAPQGFYHKKHMHAQAITTVIEGTNFYQIIDLRRTDEFV